MTIADVSGVADPQHQAAAIARWARSTWDTYSALHPVARRWVEEAL
jgi:hypothetical protein